jgi:hypothetical protein
VPTPLAIEPITQKSGADCGVACVAMISGRPYQQVADAARKIAWNVAAVGLYPSQVQALAKACRCRLTRRARKGYDEDLTGVLIVRDAQDWALHAVVIFQGCIFNPADGVLYDHDVFLSKGYDVRVCLEAM